MHPESLVERKGSARTTLVASLRRHLLRHGLPRLQMLVICSATGVAGFGVSAALLGIGMSSMASRYVIATLAAYGVFLALVRLWAEHQQRRLATAWSPPSRLSTKTPDGGAASGGRTRVYDGDTRATRTGHANGLDAASVVDIVVLDELILPLAAVGGGLVAAAWLVAAAPALLAEVLLDVVLVSGLYHRLRTLEPQSWLHTAIRRTWKPALVVAVLLAASGFVVQAALPHVVSIGDVLRQST